MFRSVLSLLMLLSNLPCPGEGKYLEELTKLPLKGAVHVLEMKGFLYVSRGSLGLSVLLHGPDRLHPVLTVNHTTADTTDARMALIENDYAYLADGEGGLGVYDLVDKINPVRVGHYSPPSTVQRIVHARNHLYLFCTSGDPSQHSLFIVNIQKPEEPFKVGRFPLKGEIVDAVATDRFLFIITKTGYILTVDLSRPHGFEIKSITPTTQLPTSIDVFREFIYVGVEDELRVYLTELPTRLEEAAKVPIGNQIRAVKFAMGNIYLATEVGITIIDVKDPRFPYESGFRRLGPVRSVAIMLDVAFLVSDTEEVIAVEVTPPPPLSAPTPTKNDFDVLKEGEKEGIGIYAASNNEKSSFEVWPPLVMHSAKMTEDMQAWRDLPESIIFDLPTWMVGALGYFATHALRQGKRIKITCKERVCNGFIFLEHCPPCTTETNGGLPAILVTAGWTPSVCGPKFKVVRGGATHATLLFRKQFRFGEREVLPFIHRDVRFIGFAVGEARTMCHEMTTENECTIGTLLCAWDKLTGSCLPTISNCWSTHGEGKMNRPPTFPSDCKTCAATELSVKNLRDRI